MDIYSSEVFKTISPIWDLLFKNYSVTLISAPRAGKNIRINYFIDNIDKINEIDKGLVKKYKNSHYVWIDLVAGVTNAERGLRKRLIERLTSCFGDAVKLSGNETITDLVGLLSDNISQGSKVIFIIDDANLLYQECVEFSSELFHINRRFPNVVQFLFLVSNELPSSNEMLTIMPQLGRIMLGKVVYFPLLSNKQISELLELRAKEIDLDLDDSVVTNIVKYSGRHPALMRILLRIVAESGSIPTNDLLLKNNEILMMFYSIWNSFLEKTQSEIRKGNYNSIEYLRATDLVGSDGKWFSELFDNYVNNIDSYFYDIEDDVFISAMSYSQRIIWGLLKENSGNIVSKEQIAKVIWGDLWLDKYSEWTIEKQISNIRRKMPSRYELENVYGKGYVVK